MRTVKTVIADTTILIRHNNNNNKLGYKQNKVTIDAKLDLKFVLVFSTSVTALSCLNKY